MADTEAQAQPEKKGRGTFYIVFSPDGEAPSRATHPTHKDAYYAAAKMAEYNPGCTFYVMKRASKSLNSETLAKRAEQSA